MAYISIAEAVELIKHSEGRVQALCSVEFGIVQGKGVYHVMRSQDAVDSSGNHVPIDGYMVHSGLLKEQLNSFYAACLVERAALNEKNVGQRDVIIFGFDTHCNRSVLRATIDKDGFINRPTGDLRRYCDAQEMWLTMQRIPNGLAFYYFCYANHAACSGPRLF